MKFKRYQLKKEALGVVSKGHPWIFRSHLSSAADIFKTGDKLQLVDGSNETVGYGIFDKEGLIGIRVIKKGKTPLDTEWIKEKIGKAIDKRQALSKYTNAYRIIHGENDGFPGIVIEKYDSVIILQVYSKSMDSLGRYVALVVSKEMGIGTVLLKEPQKRIGKDKDLDKREVRILKGSIPNKITIHEGKVEFRVDALRGQKTGTFLDLRGLRKFIKEIDLKGKRVLNLFSYTGTLGLMADIAGAKQIWNVDIAKGALEFAKQYHTKDLKKHQFIEADIFHWLEALSAHEMFDVIIVDPPNMGTKKEQVPQIYRAYEKLYTLSSKHLRPGGVLIGCCCTSRIPRKDFASHVDRYLKKMKYIKELKPEDDHPVSFPEGDYLKIRIYQSF